VPTSEEAIEANRRLWNEWAKFHVGSEFYDVASFVDGGDPIRIDDYEREEVGPVEGKTLLHLQCHFGMDTLSWARLGARVTGVDFSTEAIAAARNLAAQVGIDATFVESDVYGLPNALDGQFDIVYTSKGVLGWLPRIRPWAEVAAHFVKPGGLLYVTEVHPVTQVFADEGVHPGELRLHYPYWEHEAPITITVEGSYGGAPTAGWEEHGWDHSMGEILTALVDAGLRIEFLHEFDFVSWPVPFLVKSEDGRYRLPPGTNGQLPLFFSLKATKPA